MAEHTSCTKPGKVSPCDRIPPPTVSLPSTSNTDSPVCCSRMAAAKPFGPEPTTTASKSFLFIFNHLLMLLKFPCKQFNKLRSQILSFRRNLFGYLLNRFLLNDTNGILKPIFLTLC